MRKAAIQAMIMLLILGFVAATPAMVRCEGEETMVVAPKVFYLGYLGTKVTIHTEIAYWSVDKSTLELYGPGDEPVLPCGWKSDARGNLVVKFPSEDVMMIVAPPATDLILVGEYTDGGGFSLTGSVIVKQ